MTKLRSILLAAALALGAGGAEAQAQLPSVDYFIGAWSKVSFNDESDRARMAQVARGYCNIPYRITRSSPDTFRMFVAETERDVRLMEQGGQLYIVPATADGGVLRGARVLRVIDQNQFTLRYVENATHQRYGANVFVRCGGAPQRRG